MLLSAMETKPPCLQTAVLTVTVLMDWKKKNPQYFSASAVNSNWM